MGTVSKTLNIVANTTYNLAIDLWAWSIWATEAGITTTYSSLANLLADEKAVRQLMTVHKSVDYLANYPSGADRETLNTIINNDICAKWINLRDYALDTLSAKSNIKSVMNTADKYGYGEWGKINSTTWGPLGNVPIMTSNTAPYGEAICYPGSYSGKAPYMMFDGNDSTSWISSNSRPNYAQAGYTFASPIIPKKARIKLRQDKPSEVKIMASNGGNYEDISEMIQVSANAGYVDIELTASKAYTSVVAYGQVTDTSSNFSFEIISLQFYGRELKPLIPTMTSNTTPSGYGAIISDGAINSSYPEWHAYDGNDSTAYSGIQEKQAYIGWDFLKKTKVDFVYISEARIGTAYIEGSNNNNTWTTLATLYDSSPSTATKHYWFDIEGSEYRYYRLRATNGAYVNLMFNVLQFYYFDYSEKEFATGSTRKTIYDHGVAPSGAITGGTKNPDCLTLSAVGTATVTMNKGTRKYMGGKAGLHASGTNRLKCGSGYSNFTASNMPDSNGFDISSISGSVAVGIEQTASGTFDCTEIWIE